MADQLLTGTTLVESTSRSVGDVPIGGVIPWLKSLTGVYSYGEGWVECNGQTLVDPLSSLNGQTIPNLNGNNNFLRGNSTSGGTGGSATANHRHTAPVLWYAGDSSFRLPSDFSTGTAPDDTSSIKITTSVVGEQTSIPGLVTSYTAPSIIPPYYNVVWIMRVR